MILSAKHEDTTIYSGVSSHLKIADKLKDIKIIPEDNKNNPENWLTNNGWVKIHENNVTF